MTLSVTNSRPPLDARARRNHRIAVWWGVLVAIGFPLGLVFVLVPLWLVGGLVYAILS